MCKKVVESDTDGVLRRGLGGTIKEKRVSDVNIVVEPLKSKGKIEIASDYRPLR